MNKVKITGNNPKMVARFQRVVDRMAAMKQEHPHGLNLAIHTFTVPELLILCQKKEGVVFNVLSYSLREFLRRLERKSHQKAMFKSLWELDSSGTTSTRKV